MFWKSVARWISQAPAFGNASNASGGSVDAPCCTAPPRPYSLRAIVESSSSATRSSFTSVRTLPSAATKPPCAVPVCTLILLISAHEGVQLVDVGILAAHFADLAADRNGYALRLVRADELGEVGAQVAVDLLLFVERRLVEVHQSRGVDVDVVEAGRDLFLDECAERVELLVAIGRRIFLCVHLDVVALEEDRRLEALAQRGG